MLPVEIRENKKLLKSTLTPRLIRLLFFFLNLRTVRIIAWLVELLGNLLEFDWKMGVIVGFGFLI